MTNQRSKKRDQMVGAYVTPEVKARAKAEAEKRGMTLADYIRYLLGATPGEENKKNPNGEK